MKKRKDGPRTVLMTEDGQTRLVIDYDKDDHDSFMFATVTTYRKSARGAWVEHESIAIDRELVSDTCIALGASLYEE